jgi:hypothetical protein
MLVVVHGVEEVGNEKKKENAQSRQIGPALYGWGIHKKKVF